MARRKIGPFKKLAFKMFAPMVIRAAKEALDNDEYKDIIIEKVNEKVDLKILDEAQEKEVLDNVYDAVKVVAVSAIDQFGGK
jgi:hypothetical protein